MKICLIGEYSKKNWVGSATNKVQRYLLSVLNEKGDVILYELPYPSTYLAKLYSPLKFDHTEFGKIMSGGVINLFFFLKKENYDIIHYLVTRRFMLYIALILSFSSIKKISTFHDTLVLINNKKNIEWFLKRILIAASNLIFVYCDFDKGVISRFTQSNKIIKIKNGVDLSKYFPLKTNTEKKIITFAGGLGKYFKGLQFLENSLSRVNEKYELQICGEKSTEIKHDRFIGVLNESEFIAQLQNSYLVVVPSEYEPFSLNGLEAMACGVPIIITKSSGLSEYLLDGLGNFQVEFGDTLKLSSYVNKLLNDPKLREKMSYDARKVSQEFTWEIIGKNYLNIYNELLSHN